MLEMSHYPLGRFLQPAQMTDRGLFLVALGAGRGLAGYDDPIKMAAVNGSGRLWWFEAFALRCGMPTVRHRIQLVETVWSRRTM